MLLGLGGWPLPAGAQGAGGLVTYFNPGTHALSVTVRAGAVVGQGSLTTAFTLPPSESRAFSFRTSAGPAVRNVTCDGCHAVVYAVSDGQRLVVPLVSDLEPPTRSELVLVNEGTRRLTGEVRTGLVAGRGPLVLRFGLAPDGEVSLGLRLPVGVVLGLNVTCAGCAEQTVQYSNGVAADIVLD